MIPVASYCRVSTEKDDQANSFAAQQRYFREYIERRPDWEWYLTYADEGVSGTSTKQRTEFNRMMDDARMGKFRLILTKEVSRFSRNILDTIAFTRELKALGVGVLFMTDGICTLDPDAELRLSIMGSIAQEESRKTSSRVKWGQTRQMERGVVFGRSLLGYEVKGGALTVDPEGAELVRLIFRKYGVEKKGTSVIARELREAGYKTGGGGTKWSGSHIVRILKNEKYAGDLVQKKTYTPDYLTHAKKYNHGEERLIRLTDHHAPIVDRELWNTVQEELAKRNLHGQLSSGHSNRYAFSGKIRCGECGASFVSRKKRRKDGSVYRRWGCYTAAAEGTRHTDAQGGAVGCGIGCMLRDDLAMDILKQTLAGLRMDTDAIAEHVAALAAEAIRAGEQRTAEHAEKLEAELDTLNKKKTDVLDAFFSKRITEAELRMMNERYGAELAALQERLAAARARECSGRDAAGACAEARRRVREIVTGVTDSEALCKTLLDSMTVYADRRVEVRLKLLPMKWTFALERRGSDGPAAV